ncbi:MAG: sigma-70 family RNA polymerase sigma factor [Vicinamibacteria bacterium]|nr:sigma-70 family RNA polymerase sigma factor [Vicinamibacteria bacterium]
MTGTGGLSALEDADLARLVTVARADATEAEGELCRRLLPRLRLYGLRHLRDHAAADDLAQEVLVLVIERLRAGRIRDPERLASFAFGACRLVARNQRRGMRRRQGLIDRFGAALPQVVEPGSGTLGERRLRSCLQALEPRPQTVLVLTFYSERDSTEIARELALTAENVRAIRHRALARLRACMALGRA